MILPIHIGLFVGGSSFSFQAFKYEGSPAQERAFEVSCGIFVLVPVPEVPPISITSFADWKELLLQPGGVIESEDGEILTAEEFIEMVEVRLNPKTGSWGNGKNARPLSNRFDLLEKMKGIYGPVDPERNWKDADGYSFSMENFS